MDTETLNSSSSDKIVSRKKFLLAATGAAAYLGTTNQAKATDPNNAFLDQSTPFTANQYFGNVSVVSGYSTATGPVVIKNGYPWVDVSAYEILPSNSASINSANLITLFEALFPITVLLPTGGNTDATGNPTIYFPPGKYYIQNPIIPPNSASNYILMGAGPWSSVISWAGTVANQSMLQLINARGVTIRGLGFVGSVTFPPAYGIEINRAAGMTGTSSPTDILVENCYLGNPAFNTMGTAIGYTVASSSLDAPNGIPSGFGTFRNVTIANVVTGYKFGTANSYGNLIIGGLINGGLIGTAPNQVENTTAIDNTPGLNSSYGGSYSLFGTNLIENNLIFEIGQTTGYALNAFSARGEANNQLMTTGTTAIGAQTIQFLGGSLGVEDPVGSADTALFQSTGGQLEFHGFNLAISHGAIWNFQGSAAVAFYGGWFTTAQWFFDGPLQFHSAYETDLYPSSVFYNNLGQGLLQEYGHNGYLGGVAAGINGNGSTGSPCFTVNLNPVTAGGTVGVTCAAIVDGTPLGGQITLYTGPSTAGHTGWVMQVAFPARYTAPTVLLMPAEGNSAGAITTIYAVPSGMNSFYIYTTAPLSSTNGYIWNFIII